MGIKERGVGYTLHYWMYWSITPSRQLTNMLAQLAACICSPHYAASPTTVAASRGWTESMTNPTVHQTQHIFYLSIHSFPVCLSGSYLTMCGAL
jgi:hypothetical protein